MLNLRQKHALNKYTKHVGKIKEYDGKILCQVSNKSINKANKKKLDEIINGSEIILTNPKEKFRKTYKIDKELTFIIENKTLKGPITLKTSYANVIIRNCILEGSLTLHDSSKSKVTLENNIYKDTYSSKYDSINPPSIGKALINGNINELVIVNDIFENNSQIPIKVENKKLITTNENCDHFGIDINANKVTIENTKFNGYNNIKINIVSNIINLIDSKIKVEKNSKINLTSKQELNMINTYIDNKENSIINLNSNNKIRIIATRIFGNLFNINSNETIIKDSELKVDNININSKDNIDLNNSSLIGNKINMISNNIQKYKTVIHEKIKEFINLKDKIKSINTPTTRETNPFKRTLKK